MQKKKKTQKTLSFVQGGGGGRAYSVISPTPFAAPHNSYPCCCGESLIDTREQIFKGLGGCSWNEEARNIHSMGRDYNPAYYIPLGQKRKCPVFPHTATAEAYKPPVPSVCPQRKQSKTITVKRFFNNCTFKTPSQHQQPPR